MFTISHGIFTPPGKFIINDSRANFTERISYLHNNASPIHFHHTNSKKRFHNVNTVVCVLDSCLKKGEFHLSNFDIEKLKLSVEQYIAYLESIPEGSIAFNEHDENYKNFIQTLQDINEGLKKISPDSIKEALAENDSHEARPAINAQTHKSEIVILERSKAGRKLQDDDELQALYNEMELRFTTAEIKNRQGGITEIKTVMSLSYEQVKEWENYMPAFHRLKKIDIEILAHAATLYTAGNRIISTDMLFRQMNGGKKQQPTEAMRREIYDSFCRLGRTWLYIDASQEVKAGLNKKAEFRGALLPCSMIIGDTILNGQPAHDCIKIYDTSPLIEYARLKGQVSPIPLDMFNIPNVNRTEENIMLIGYLTRAFADMRNEKSDRNKHIISYQPIYDYLGVKGSNPTQLRKNKAKIRKTVRAILDSWCEGLHIKGYQELTANDKPARERVIAAKIRIEFFTAKEKK